MKETTRKHTRIYVCDYVPDELVYDSTLQNEEEDRDDPYVHYIGHYAFIKCSARIHSDAPQKTQCLLVCDTDVRPDGSHWYAVWLNSIIIDCHESGDVLSDYEGDMFYQSYESFDEVVSRYPNKFTTDKDVIDTVVFTNGYQIRDVLIADTGVPMPHIKNRKVPSYWILNDLEGYGSAFPVCVDRTTKIYWTREWDCDYSIWREATYEDCFIFGIFHHNEY